jgi:hypothetical protein
MFIITWIAKSLLARGLSTRSAGILSWAIPIAGAALLIWGGWSLLKHNIISNHDDKQRAEQAERQLGRVGTADAVDDSLEKRDAAVDDAVKGAIDDAVRNDPSRGASPAGPVSNAAVDELRRSRRERGDAPAR